MDERALAVRDGSYLMPAMQIGQAATRYNQIVGFVKNIMKPTIHYGIIPGTEKPTLLKPGAEMLTTFFGLTPRFITVKEIEDWTGAQSGGEPFFYYRFTCQLWRGDIMVAEADGSCNSHESRYRWRWVGEDDLPEGVDKATLKKRGGTVSEFGFAIDKAETGGKYGKPAAYWQQFKDAIDNGEARPLKKATKTGKQYDAWEIDSTMYRVPNDDIASQANTILKIAQKRAYIAAVLIGVNASEFFTQDLEDLDIVDAPRYIVEQPTGPAWTEVVVNAGEEPPAKPEPPKSGSIPCEPSKFFAAVNQETGFYYKNLSHLANTLKKEIGRTSWPATKDVDSWGECWAAAVKHAEAKSEQFDEQPPLVDDNGDLLL